MQVRDIKAQELWEAEQLKDENNSGQRGKGSTGAFTFSYNTYFQLTAYNLQVDALVVLNGSSLELRLEHFSLRPIPIRNTAVQLYTYTNLHRYTPTFIYTLDITFAWSSGRLVRRDILPSLLPSATHSHSASPQCGYSFRSGAVPNEPRAFPYKNWGPRINFHFFFIIIIFFFFTLQCLLLFIIFFFNSRSKNEGREKKHKVKVYKKNLVAVAVGDRPQSNHQTFSIR